MNQVLAWLSVVVGAAGDGSGKVIPWDAPGHKRDIVGLIEELEGIYPPPPAVEVVEVGTLDCATGDFIWAPGIQRRESGVDHPYDDIRIFEVFDQHGIKPIVVDLEPTVINLASIPGLAGNVDLSGVNVAGLDLGGANLGGADLGGASFGGADAGGAVGSGVSSPNPAPKPRPSGDARRKPPVSDSPDLRAPDLATPRGIEPFVGNPLKEWHYFKLVRAGKVDFLVRAVNRPAGANLTLVVEERSSSADADAVDLIVPPRCWTTFRVSCGSASFEDVFFYERPPQLGLFSLEAFPVTVIYEPPGPGSEQRYETSKQVGTTLRTFERSSNSVETPVATAFTETDEAIEIIGKIGGAVANAYPAVGAAIQGASSVLGAAWGEAEIDETVKHETSKEHGLSLSLRESETVYTNAGLGPGRGDVVHYLVSPTFVWLAAQDMEKNRVYVTVALLGYRRPASITVEGLRGGSGLGISDATRQALIAHDVLTPEHAEARRRGGLAGLAPDLFGSGSSGDSYSNPSPRRLVPAKDFEREFDAGIELELERTIEEEDVLTTSTTKTVATEQSGGFLSFVATNVPHDDDTTVSTTYGTSSSTKVNKTIKATAKLVGEVDDPHLVHCWYDKLSGTFAFQDAPYTEESVSGAMTSADGEPVAGEEVRLVTADGLTAVTKTDEQGRFRFRSPLLRDGKHELVARDAKLPIEWKGKSLVDQQLRVGKSTGRPTARGNPAEPRGGRTRPEIDRAPEAEHYTVTPDPEIKGRLGRIAVGVPEGVNGGYAKIEIFGDDPTKSLHWNHGPTQTELFPGIYRVAVNGRAIENVEVRRGHVTRIEAGGLRVHAGPKTKIEIREPDAEKSLTWQNGGPWLVALVPGDYEVHVNGRSERVTIGIARVVDF